MKLTLVKTTVPAPAITKHGRLKDAPIPPLALIHKSG